LTKKSIGVIAWWVRRAKADPVLSDKESLVQKVLDTLRLNLQSGIALVPLAADSDVLIIDCGRLIFNNTLVT
jgi:hypothetical protein